MPQVVVSGGGRGGGRRWLRALFIIIVIALLAGAGWYVFAGRGDKAKKPAAVHSKDVPLIKVGFSSADYGGLYPDMSVNDYSISANMQIFEGLVRYENESKIVPVLASDWTNPDSVTWVFSIKKGVKYHDGHTLTAADVKDSLDRLLASGSGLAETFAATIKSVSLAGSDKVRITTAAPDPTLLNKLSFLYVIDPRAPKGSDPSKAGTGPYQLKPGTKAMDTDIQLVAFDGYHGGRPTTRALSYGTSASMPDLLKGLQDGRYDIIGYVPLNKAKDVKKRTFRFNTAASDIDFIGFNTVRPGPAKNRLVREAIRYAVDPKAIGRVRGSDVMALSQMIPPSIPGYNPAIPTYEQDISRAKQLLAKAGYPKGLTLRYSISSDTPEETAEISGELKKAGITLKIDHHDDFDEFIDYFSTGKADMFTVDYSSDTLDGLDIYTTTLQAANYDNPKTTKLLEQAATTVDQADRLRLLQDVADIVDQDIPTVPLSTENDLWLMSRNFSIHQDTPSGYLPVYFYKVQLK